MIKLKLTQSETIELYKMYSYFLPLFMVNNGWDEVVNELVATAHYKSKADVMHESLQILAARKLPGTFYWINKIQ